MIQLYVNGVQQVLMMIQFCVNVFLRVLVEEKLKLLVALRNELNDIKEVANINNDLIELLK